MRRSTILKSLLAAAFAGGLALGAAAPGLADGSSDPGECKDGDNCNSEPSRSDREIYNAGYLLAHAGRYQDALTMLRQAKDQSHPAIQNYLGFSKRKLGDVDAALVHYKKARPFCKSKNRPGLHGAQRRAVLGGRQLGIGGWRQRRPYHRSRRINLLALLCTVI